MATWSSAYHTTGEVIDRAEAGMERYGYRKVSPLQQRCNACGAAIPAGDAFQWFPARRLRACGACLWKGAEREAVA